MRQLRGPPTVRWKPSATRARESSRSITSHDCELTGRRGNHVEDELPVNADGGFVTTISATASPPSQRNVSLQLGDVADVQDATLRDELLHVAAGKQGRPRPSATQPPSAERAARWHPYPTGLAQARAAGQRPVGRPIALRAAGQHFRTSLNRPEDVLFRYDAVRSGYWPGSAEPAHQQHCWPRDRRRRSAVQASGTPDDLPAALGDPHRDRGGVWPRRCVHRISGLQAARPPGDIRMIPTARPSLVQAPPAIPRGDTASRTVPFDYSFRFALDGIPRSVLRTTLTISVEASFTAVSIGYGVVPEVSPVIFGPRPAPVIFLAPAAGSRIRDITLGDLFESPEAALSSTPDVPKGMPPLEAALRNGIKLNADFAALGCRATATRFWTPSRCRSCFRS